MFKIYYDFNYFRRPCLRNHYMRNVWRALPFASGTPLGVPWPERSPMESGTVLAGDRLGRQACRMKPGRLRPIAFWHANFANGYLLDPAQRNVRSGGRMRTLHGTHGRTHTHTHTPMLADILKTSGGVSCVGGGAMHMKCPDDIGRVAGIGRTPVWKELK